MSKIGIYPGTFDPITYGHIDVIRKALKIVDKVIIAVSENANKNYLIKCLFHTFFTIFIVCLSVTLNPFINLLFIFLFFNVSDI